MNNFWLGRLSLEYTVLPQKTERTSKDAGFDTRVHYFAIHIILQGCQQLQVAYCTYYQKLTVCYKISVLFTNPYCVRNDWVVRYFEGPLYCISGKSPIKQMDSCGDRSSTSNAFTSNRTMLRQIPLNEIHLKY